MGGGQMAKKGATYLYGGVDESLLVSKDWWSLVSI